MAYSSRLSPSLVLFHILTIDFIFTFSLSGEGLNAVLSIICKYSKSVTLVPGKDTWSEDEWAWALLSRFELIDLGRLAVFLSDRDPKFLSKL